MVTHNANLAINTDADQIVIAEAGPHPAGALPPIAYTSGGLEDARIRQAVCGILEGGEGAFQERARRLRVKTWRAKEEEWRAAGEGGGARESAGREMATRCGEEACGVRPAARKGPLGGIG